MDGIGISRSRGWDKDIPHDVLPMEQLVLSDKWEENIIHVYILCIITARVVIGTLMANTCLSYFRI